MDCCIRIIAQWTFRVWVAGIDGGSSGADWRSAGSAVLVTRLSYRILSGIKQHGSRESRSRAVDVTGNALTIRPGIPSRPCGQLGTRP